MADMPAHKNQHFVPRCVLKPFSLNSEGRAINLYAFERRKLIPNAPLKNQCARDYMYGKGGGLERALAQIESGYAISLRHVFDKTDSDFDRQKLRFFAFLQLRRTETAIMRVMQAQAKMTQDLFEEDERPPEPPREWFMYESLKSCLEMSNIIEDLKIRIVENRTKRDFVSSDDPATLTNRFKWHKWKSRTFGLSSSGLILSMPLTPRLAVICYDGLVYTAPSLINQRMVLDRVEDVESLNELQFLRASASIYFQSWTDGPCVSEKFEEARARRPVAWATITHAYYAGNDDTGEVYRAGTLEQAKASGQSLMHMSFQYAVPSVWLSQLKFREKPKTFNEGTAVGHVRKREWLRGMSTASPFHTRPAPKW